VSQQTHNIEYIVLLFHQGDERGLAYVFDKLYPLMVYYANEWVKDRMLAEDIASMAFVKAWQHHDKLDSFAGIKGYLLRTVQRDCNRASFYENKRNQKHKLAVKEQKESQTAFHTLVKAETYNNLHQAIKQLSPGMRDVMQSMYIDGNSLTETARILNIHTSTADTQKKRALKILSRILPNPGLYIFCLIFLFC